MFWSDAPLMTPARPYSGIFPIAPVPFHDNGELDLDGMRRVLDCMIDQRVDGICILANFSEQFLLTDAERQTLLELSLTHGRPGSGDCHMQPLQHAHRRRARAHRRASGSRNADADAALPRRAVEGG